MKKQKPQYDMLTVIWAKLFPTRKVSKKILENIRKKKYTIRKG